MRKIAVHLIQLSTRPVTAGPEDQFTCDRRHLRTWRLAPRHLALLARVACLTRAFRARAAISRGGDSGSGCLRHRRGTGLRREPRMGSGGAAPGSGPDRTRTGRSVAASGRRPAAGTRRTGTTAVTAARRHSRCEHTAASGSWPTRNWPPQLGRLLQLGEAEVVLQAVPQARAAGQRLRAKPSGRCAGTPDHRQSPRSVVHPPRALSSGRPQLSPLPAGGPT